MPTLPNCSLEYVLNSAEAFYHLFRISTDHRWQCTCKVFNEKGMCKHSLSYDVECGLLELTGRASVEAIGLKPQNGRPKKPTTIEKGQSAALSKALKPSLLKGRRKRKANENPKSDSDSDDSDAQGERIWWHWGVFFELSMV